MQKSTFIIAEAGINHNGDVGRALALVDAAKEAGCDAVKFQTYQTDLRVDKSNSAYDVLKKCELTYEQTADVKWHADKVGIEFFSTPFDEHSLAFLVEDLGVRRVKLASFDVTNRRLLQLVNECGKRYAALKVIMSTGMSNTVEISDALRCFPDIPNLTLLHCISSYPTPEEEVNLSAIKTLRRLLHGDIEVGYSDHTDDILIPALAVLVGATTIEKHFTLDLNGPGIDNPVSADPKMMKDMVSAIRDHEMFLGDGMLGMKDIEQAATVFRRYS